MVTAGRRELHKRATRQALQEAATRMFEERGYAETAVRGTGVALLFSGLPGQVFSRPARTAQPVLLELEDGLTAALHDRLGDSGGGQDERALSLRASVLARACVAALRATVLAFHALPEEERTLESARGLARQAFDILNDAPRER